MKNVTFEQYKQANYLEIKLGSIEESSNLFSFDEIIKLDEQSEFPERQAELLSSLGVHKYFVPLELGGKLNSFEEFVSVFRTIYRRDPTLALGYGATTFMAAIHAFIAGSEEIKNKIANIVLNGNTMSIAYHEKEHGNDLLGNEVIAIKQENNSYHISGKKWVINNAAVSKGITVFAKTSENAPGRGFSLFFIDKESVDKSTLVYMPKVKTLGVKGCRIAGVEFNNTQISENSIIGKLGEGTELTFKAFQVTRATLPGMSLGAADTALRCVVDFANKRVLYGQPIIKISHVYETLVDSFIQILICDVQSITASRSLHYLPEQMSIIASLTKFYIPKKIQTVLKDLSVILGARHYVRKGEYSIFQKIIRDYPLVSLGHSSDVICMSTIMPQMKSLLTKNIQSEKIENLIENIFSLDKSLPKFSSSKLKISNNGFNDIIKSINFIENNLVKNTHPEDIKKIIKKTITHIKKILTELKENISSIQVNINTFNKQTYQYIESYCQCFLSISCIWLWIFNDGKISDYFNRGAWLAIALKHIFPNANLFEKSSCKAFTIESFEYLQYLFVNKKSFSIVPIQFQ